MLAVADAVPERDGRLPEHVRAGLLARLGRRRARRRAGAALRRGRAGRAPGAAQPHLHACAPARSPRAHARQIRCAHRGRWLLLRRAECGYTEYSEHVDSAACTPCPNAPNLPGSTGKLGATSASDCGCEEGYEKPASAVKQRRFLDLSRAPSRS